MDAGRGRRALCKAGRMTGVAKLRVLVTCPPMLGLFDEFVPTFAAHGLDADAAQVVQILTEDELIKRLPEYDGWIIGDDPASARVLEAGKAGRLKAIRSEEHKSELQSLMRISYAVVCLNKKIKKNK